MSESTATAVKSFVAKRDYRGADMELVRRITAAAAFLTGFVIVALAPLAPPDEALGEPAGWAILAVVVGGYVLLGLRLKRTVEFRPDMAVVTHLAGLTALALAIWLSGGRESPYMTLFLFWMAIAGASHPPRRALAVIGFTNVVACLPLLYDSWSSVFAADVALRLVIWSALSVMACVWTTRVRMQRADLIQDEEDAKRQARIDALTGLGNRRAFDERLDRVIEHARLEGKPLSVIVSDLDDFKEINDSYGHLNGDELLRTAASAMRAAVRDADACYRWGGDEFAVLLPGVEQDVAEKVAERVSAAIVASCIRPCGDPQTLAWGSAELALSTRKHKRQRGTRFRAEAPNSDTDRT
jgi:diguanylate cyclase (GGDEF)-like protein